MKFDLVITDINMPCCDGITFLTGLKESNNDQFPCKVIVISGAVTTKQLKQVNALKVDQFVLKPIQFDKLKILRDEHFGELNILARWQFWRNVPLKREIF